MLPSRTALAAPTTDYILNPQKGYFSVIIPTGRDRVNHVPNPSFELGTSVTLTSLSSWGWSASGATLSASTERVRRGCFAGKVVPSATTCSVYSTAIPYSMTGPMALSLDVWMPGGQTLTIAISTSSAMANAVVKKVVTGNGGWQRVGLVLANATVIATPVLVFETTNAVVSRAWFIDGIQLEGCAVGEEYETTYFDGDMRGVVPDRQDFYWGGKPHASPSVRRGQCRLGGRQVPLASLGLKVTSFQGLGLSPITNVVLPNVVSGGMLQAQQSNARDFAIIGAVEGEDLAAVESQVAQLSDAFKPDLTSPAQPLVLRFEYYDDCGGTIFEPLEVRALYRSGLEGQVDNLNQQRIAIQMTAYEPEVLADSTSGAYVNPCSYPFMGLTQAGYVLLRDTGGGIAQVGVFAGAAAYKMLEASDGRIYMIGAFTDINSIANTRFIAAYHKQTGTWSSVATVAGGTAIQDIVEGVDGTIWFAGDFTGVDSVAGTARVCGIRFEKSGSTKHVLTANGATLAGNACALARDEWGSIIVGFSTSDATYGYMMQFTPDAARNWSLKPYAANAAPALGGAVLPRSVAVAHGRVYAMLATGFAYIPNSRAASPWGAWVTVFAETVGYAALATDLDGNVLFHSNTRGLTQFNGSTLSLVGSPNPITSITFANLHVGASGWVYVSSALAFASNVTAAPRPRGLHIWNRSAAVAGEIDADAAPVIACETQGGTLYAFNGSGATLQEHQLRIAATATLNVLGSRAVFPRISVMGGGVLQFVRNLRTRSCVYLDANAAPNDVLTCDFSRRQNQITSIFQGNVGGVVQPGSDLSFSLLPGVNEVQVLAPPATVLLNQQATGAQWNGSNHCVLTGVTPLNSDQGRLYVSAPNTTSFNFYSDAGRTQLVAQITGYAGAGIYAVVQQNSSGISGRIYMGTAPAVAADGVLDVPLVRIEWRNAYWSAAGVAR